MAGNISLQNYFQNSSSNQSTVHWDYLSVSTCVSTVSGILTNGLVLLVILKNYRTLVTPFSIYLMNLLTGNLLNLVLFYPLSVINHASEGSWKLGNTACTLFMYGQYVLNASLGHGHLAISLNRLWAVTFPLSYRTRHNRLFALRACIVLWVYIHVVLLPGVVLDTAYYRFPVETNGCQLNSEAQMKWSTCAQILAYDMPVVLIFLIYLFVAYQTLKRNSKKTGQVRPTQSQGCRPISVFGQRFMVMTLTTASILICHTPEQVQDTMWFITGNDSGSLGGPFLLLMAIPTVMDPLLFALTLSDVRKALLDFLISKHS